MSDELKDVDRGEESSTETKRVKVTDRRMFTPDGELREEYAFLQKDSPDSGAGEQQDTGEERQAKAQEPPREAPQAPPRPASPPSSAVVGEPPPAAPRGDVPPGAAAGEGRPLEMDLGPSPAGQPGFLDLLSILAEPVAIYLGDVELPDGRTAENLDAARLHIDLLEVLREKTAGNLSSQEMSILEDLLYRLRMRYVQKRG